MKTLAYIPLHYGSDYLKAALTSIDPFVDTILILYSETPTYGHSGSLKNPDTKEVLQSICAEFDKVRWVDITNRRISRENVHRELAYQYAREKGGYDLVFAVDADEVWEQSTIEETLTTAYNSNAFFNHIGHEAWLHFWKGHKEYNTDGFYPLRIVNLNNNNTDHTILNCGRLYHMGYAISEDAMRYKISCHGHKREIAQTWMHDKWLNYQKGVTTHLHPASQDVWIETKIFEGKLPDYL